MTRRPERVQSLIREELGKIILKEMEFPAESIVTIADVEVEKKLESAKVKVSVIPSSAEAETLAQLGKSAGRLQYLLMKKINIKPMPRICFEIDHGLENAAQVEKLLLNK